MNLPVPAESLVPHKPPVLMVDRLLHAGNEEAVVETSASENNLLANTDGTLDPVAAVELIAQACAAARGYEDQASNALVKKGFLVAVRKLRIENTIMAGDRIRICIQTRRMLDGFVAADGSILRGDTLMATASLRLRIMEDE